MSDVLHGRGGMGVCLYKRVRGFRRVHGTKDGVSCMIGASTSLDHGIGTMRNAIFYDKRANFSLVSTSGGRLYLCVVGGRNGILRAMERAHWYNFLPISVVLRAQLYIVILG